MIRDVPADIGNIVDNLLKSNPEINTILDASQEEYIKVITSKVPECKNVVIETSPILYKNIMKTGKVRIGMCIYRIIGHVHIIKCQKCQKFGHREDGPKPCRALKPTCSICGEEHYTNTCKGYNTDITFNQIENFKKCANCSPHDHGAIEKSKCKEYSKRKNEQLAKFKLQYE